MPKITLKQLQHLPELHRLVCEQLIWKGSWQLVLDADEKASDLDAIPISTR
ncbi:MAG: hypothetical protein ABFC71_03730 [Methanoregula sp.]